MSAPPKRYRIAADHRRRCETLRDLLSLVMSPPPPLSQVMGWSAEQREHAEDWALREHLSAADNPTQRLVRPMFLSVDG